MNVFVSENPTVRIWKEKSTGRIMRADTNIHPDTKVEVVEVPDGESIMSVDEKIEGSHPYGCRITAPEPRQ